MLNKEELDLSRIPQHVAIIMDGNGRWAKLRGQERSYGHQAGAETVHVIAEEASKLGIKYLTLYTFSTENWNRPSNEVAALMALLFDSIEEETFMKNNISFRVIGDLTKLPDNVRERLETCIAHTANNTGMSLVLPIQILVPRILGPTQHRSLPDQIVRGGTTGTHLGHSTADLIEPSGILIDAQRFHERLVIVGTHHHHVVV